MLFSILLFVGFVDVLWLVFCLLILQFGCVALCFYVLGSSWVCLFFDYVGVFACVLPVGVA